MIGAIIYQLTKDATEKEIKDAGFESYFVDHTTGVYPSSAAGVPFTAAYIQSKGDPITDLHENMAAEQTLCKHYVMLYKPYSYNRHRNRHSFSMSIFLQFFCGNCKK